MRWMRRHGLAPALLGALAACGGGDGGGGDDGGNEPPPGSTFQVQAGGDNVNDRYSSDLWVHGSWAYTGTWGGGPRNGVSGDVVKIWSLDAAGAPTGVAAVRGIVHYLVDHFPETIYTLPPEPGKKPSERDGG